MGEILFTLQTFAVAMSLFLLGGKAGSSCVAIYLTLGCVGIPVFSGFQGGFSALIGPTGGFIMGFAAWSLLYWFLVSSLGRKFRIPVMFLGLLVCYICGCLWISFFYDYPLLLAIVKCVLPFVIPDCAKIMLAWFLAKRLKKYVY